MDLFSSTSVFRQINRFNTINKPIGNSSLDVHYSKASNIIIYETLLLRENLKYWENINSYLVYKVYYGLRVLPFKIYHNRQKLLEKFTIDNVKTWLNNPTIVNPMDYINVDIRSHINDINKELDANYNKLGTLIENSTSSESKLATINQVFESIDPESYKVKWMEPHWLVKYWVDIGVVIVVAPLVSLKIVRNKSAIADWISQNLVGLVTGFYNNWIVAPLKLCINIIKQDDNIIMSKDSLNSDLSSLERMVTEYLQDYENIPVATDSNIKEQIEQGDLTAMMSRYENDIKSPIKNIIRGRLIRGLLIQVQKTKVDGDMVITGIDKLIKSQQLLLALVSISPSIFIVYQLVNYLNKPNFIVNGKDVKLSCLNNMNQLVTPNNLSNKGKLLVTVINLKIEAKLVLKKPLFKLFERDLNDLIQGNISVDKIWLFYVNYFK